MSLDRSVQHYWSASGVVGTYLRIIALVLSCASLDPNGPTGASTRSQSSERLVDSLTPRHGRAHAYRFQPDTIVGKTVHEIESGVKLDSAGSIHRPSENVESAAP